ncbi:hypothetical protein ACPFUU_003580 [Vibrio cholerae]|nr:MULTISPECIES: hypothetical protein [Vibrio]EGQ8476462.1 hypothetical protein [Vibrio cholerae]EGR2840602.1 hypothetical protein [Vibrio cholerae]EHD2282649.1 hypothetical protein [Vibrio cholerae]EJL6311509.1 hypothetical protein [Vibrio cholerae]EJL6368343.1 hypothetical protein [Vibrio cholerae]
MNDNQKTRKLRKMAMIYLLILLLPFVSSALTDKENGRGLLFVLWPLVSIWYFVAYRQIAKTYECPMTKHVAFSKGGGGTFHGILYYFSTFILFALVVLLIRGTFGL